MPHGVSPPALFMLVNGSAATMVIFTTGIRRAIHNLLIKAAPTDAEWTINFNQLLGGAAVAGK